MVIPVRAKNSNQVTNTWKAMTIPQKYIVKIMKLKTQPDLLSIPALLYRGLVKLKTIVSKPEGLLIFLSSKTPTALAPIDVKLSMITVSPSV